MPESSEDETFTFVDKRGAGSSDDAEPSAPAGTPTDTLDFGEEDDVESASGGSIGSFELAAYVVGLMASDAWQKMGLIVNPATGQMNRDLTQAKFSIDCAAAIVAQMEMRESAAPAKLVADLQRVLNDLRLNFIEQSRR